MASKEAPVFDPDSFRDRIATVDESGKRRWIYPKQPFGQYYNWRKIVSYLCLIILFGMPFLKVNGQPFFLFNVLERKFILFGLTFWPQDFHLFALAMVTLFVFIVLFTVMFGRIWCGWACPQTIFMEMVFRRIEYWIEGTHTQQIRLAKAPWNRDKILKKGSKWGLFALISFLIGNTLMAWIIGVDELAEVVIEAPTQNWGRFTFVMLFSGIFLFIFTYFREQACIAVCPYGRLQGVLLGKKSIVVIYDWLRGEPRGKKSKQNAAKELGDCVSCNQCVAVCPTGIDIRNGTQMECVNCTACIDACNNIMDKVGRPRGLIRYDSYDGIMEGSGFKLTTRVFAYCSVLLALISVLSFSLSSRSAVETTILRSPGSRYQTTEDGLIVNLYSLQFINKTQDNIHPEVLLSGHPGELEVIGKEVVVEPQGMYKGAILIKIRPEDLDSRATKIQLSIQVDGQEIDRIKSSFLGPMK
ncbi:MAG: cytochrome c oxidase accessory protein CcoG [Bacteroidota bacterium]